MPRISNNTFKVNDNLEQQIELTAVGPSVSIPISTSIPLDVTSNLAEVHGSAITLGQKAKANSLPVTLASDEDTININIESVSQQSLDFGQEPMVSSLPVVIASDQSAVSSNITAVASGVSFPITSSAELDVSSNITAINTSDYLNTHSNIAFVGGTAINLGQTSSTFSLPVVFANDVGIDVTSNLAEVHGETLTLGSNPASASIPVVLANDTIPTVSANISRIDSTAKTNAATTLSAFQVGNYGWDGSQWRQMNVSNGGNLKVQTELENHAGSQGNLDNGSSVTAGSNSAVIDTSNNTLLTVFGDTTDTSNGIQPQISADNTNWVDLDYEIYPKFNNGNFYQNIDNTAVNYFRLKYSGAATVTATLLQNNH